VAEKKGLSGACFAIVCGGQKHNGGKQNLQLGRGMAAWVDRTRINLAECPQKRQLPSVLRT